MDQWLLSWTVALPGTFWALLIPVATCAILIYAIERENNSGNSREYRHSVRKQRQFAVTSSSVIVVVEDVDAADELDAAK
jgi:hypothetical protein